MRFDRKCRKHVCELLLIAPFVDLLRSDERRSTSIGNDFNELIRMPRSSSTGFLERIQKQGSFDNMTRSLFLLTQNSELKYRAFSGEFATIVRSACNCFASNFYIQKLSTLTHQTLFQEYKCEKRVHRERVLESLTREDQIGGTYQHSLYQISVGLIPRQGNRTQCHGW